MQKAVVKNMNWGNDVPTYQVSRAITTDKMDALYAKLKPKGVTVSALLAKAVGMTLAKHPIMNAAYVQDGIKYNPNIVQQPNGMMGMVKQMTVTLTCDHRHIYGADAAKFLKDLAALIENDIDSVLY